MDIMDNENFEIFAVNYKDGKKFKYRMQVEITYRSDHVIRFRLFAGKKEMIMEKLFTKHTGQWKIKEMNFEFTGKIQDIAWSIRDIQDEIDFYLAGRPKSENKYKGK